MGVDETLLYVTEGMPELLQIPQMHVSPHGQDTPILPGLLRSFSDSRHMLFRLTARVRTALCRCAKYALR